MLAANSGYSGTREEFHKYFGTYLETNKWEILFEEFTNFPTAGDIDKLYFDLDEKILDEIISKNISITHIITHTSPDFCFRKGLDKIKMLLLSDPPFEKDINESRKVLTDIYNYLLKKGQKIKTWTYGHFHESNKEIINGITFTCLINADNFFEYISLDTEK